MNQEILKQTIKDMEKQIKEQQEVINRLKEFTKSFDFLEKEEVLYTIDDIKKSNRFERNGTSDNGTSYDECYASKLW